MEKMSHCIFFNCFLSKVISKTRASCFVRGSKHLETIKAHGLPPHAFICFSLFGTHDETFAFVFDILLYGVWKSSKTLSLVFDIHLYKIFFLIDCFT